MSKEILEELSHWKLDAKFEEMDRYFYNIREVNEIKSGQKAFVIGRKGSGKTAISEMIYKQVSPTVFTEKLTFKNFPFNELYNRSNDSYTRPNQYITLWEYLIYSSICRMMVRNQAIDLEARTALEKMFGGLEPITNLRRSITQWTTGEMGLSLMGTGGVLKRVQTEPELSQSWIQRIDVLEDIIKEYLDDSHYYILFDELDEDYKNIVDAGDQNNYLSLITSIFKATQDIRSKFIGRLKIFPIIVLRDDIYNLILDPDKNKWTDFKVDLDWDEQEIKRLLAFRLSRAYDKDSVGLPFDEIWYQVFAKSWIPYSGGRKNQPVFDFITRSTQLRPRDYIKYIQTCAEDSLRSQRIIIVPATVKYVDKAFSNYLKSELIDEIHGIIPEIQEIMSIISEIRKWNFPIDEFRDIYNQRVKNGTIKNRDVEFVLKTLFHFSVIGNSPRFGIEFFRYKSRDATFSFKERLVVHRGLFKALQII